MKISVLGWSILLCLSIVSMSSCDIFEVHPYSGKIEGEQNINAKNIQLIEQQFSQKDTVKFAFISDSQKWYDQLEDFVTYANNRNDIDFIIHGGDVSDYGLTKEILWQRDILNRLHAPYVVIIGNHDCLANGEQVFKQVFGELNFSFIAGKTKFLCLNTNALENDYSVPIPDFNYIKNEKDKRADLYNKTVVAMHANPTSEQFNNNVADLFHYYINQYKNLQFCVNGHNHRYEVNNIFDDDIYYYGAPAIGQRQFLLFTITPKSYTHEMVTY